MHSLSHQGIDKDAYLGSPARTEEELLEEAKPDAEQALRREAVIAAVIEAEGIAPSDGDVLDALQSSAARENTTPEKLRDRLEQAGGWTSCATDLAQRLGGRLARRDAPSRSASSRRRRATSSGRLIESRPRARGGQLWTPGS